ncbi:hypothetical protein Bca4012_096980 [Brassica carinata]
MKKKDVYIIYGFVYFAPQFSLLLLPFIILCLSFDLIRCFLLVYVQNCVVSSGSVMKRLDLSTSNSFPSK